MTLGREIELVQKHRAEEDLAVAAASILARHEFVTRLGALEKQFGAKFPKGASAAVDAAAKEFVAKHGPDGLAKVAKMHFRTALRAQGLPEPPKVEWRRRPVSRPARTDKPSHRTQSLDSMIRYAHAPNHAEVTGERSA